MKRFPSLTSVALLAAVLATAAVCRAAADSPAAASWQEMLPNIPMPSSLRDTFDSGEPRIWPSSYKDRATTVSLFHYHYAASTEQLRDPKVAVFFLEKDLRAGNKMNLTFSKAVTESAPGDRKAIRLPLNEKNLPDILSVFSLEPESEEARALMETIRTCDEPAATGEDKHCATSLESMVEFATSKLGKNVLALETTVEKETSEEQEEYTVSAGMEELKGRKSVACHYQPFIYPVYYCHETADTTAYVIPLVGKDGSEAKAVAVCHKDTSSWNPNNLAFQLLKVKPGSVPVCHFIPPQGHVVWVQK